MKSRSSSLLFVVCCIFLAGGILRLNDLSLYTPDSTRYVIWGNSIAHGHGYVDTTLPDPDRFVIHAPLYSLLIAPVETMFPHSLIAVKTWTLLWGIFALVLFYRWMKRAIGPQSAIIGTIILACNPLMFLYSTEALSEVPFIAITMAAFIIIERLVTSTKQSDWILWILLPAACLLREVGVSLIIATAIMLLMRKEWKQTLILLVCSAIVIGGWYIRNVKLVGPPAGSPGGNLSYFGQHLVTPANASIIKEFIFRSWLQLKEYAIILGGMLFYPQFGTKQVGSMLETMGGFGFFESLFSFGKYILVCAIVTLMAVGIRYDVKHSPTARFKILFAFLYLAIILVYPIHDVRFIFPLLPLMIYYCIKGIQSLRGTVPAFNNLTTKYAFIGALLVVMPNIATLSQLITTNMSYVKSPVEFANTLERLPNYPTIYTMPWNILGERIRQELPESVVIASPAKELAIVCGNRKVLELDPGVSQPIFDLLLRDNHVEYLLAPVRWSNLHAFEFLMHESRRFRFQEVEHVANLVLFKVDEGKLWFLKDQPSNASRADSEYMSFAFRDTLTAGGLLIKGRSELFYDNLGQATTYFRRALALSPNQPEIIYQSLIAYAQQGDSANAVQAYEHLLTLPQTGSYLLLSRAQLQAMELTRNMQRRNSEDLDIKTYNTASSYWGLGYPHHAFNLMHHFLEDSANYFVGLLWGWEYASQLGDMGEANRFLTQLHSIDSSNPVVKAFDRITLLGDSIGTMRTLSGEFDFFPEISRLFLSRARIYRQMELFEDAIDDAQTALHLDPSNKETAVFLAEQFERKSRTRVALQYYLDAQRLSSSQTNLQTKIDSLTKIVNTY